MPKGKGWMGEKAWWYANSDQQDVSSFLEVVQDLIKGKPALQIPAEEIQPPPSFEGAKKSIIVNVYERDPSARKACINHWGAKCIVCGFDFESAYGEIGKGFIHVHHLVPLSSIGKRYKIDPIKELRPICPNCHSMIHRERKKILTVEALRKVLKR
ncbi:MAG: HNH endonuclease [Proteobacteria bacterium]|nr:HNH endonuclease [Pseudomonadota bacterium]MBU1546531.1 HNH endonuclease [Pseudomonadota bacterium]MBU2619136.1 HNH endonuclease [Pseudomonadota bacterium]